MHSKGHANCLGGAQLVARASRASSASAVGRGAASARARLDGPPSTTCTAARAHSRAAAARARDRGTCDEPRVGGAHSGCAGFHGGHSRCHDFLARRRVVPREARDLESIDWRFQLASGVPDGRRSRLQGAPGDALRLRSRDTLRGAGGQSVRRRPCGSGSAPRLARLAGQTIGDRVRADSTQLDEVPHGSIAISQASGNESRRAPECSTTRQRGP